MKSRKLWIAISVMIISMFLPLAYKEFDISEAITITVLAIVSAVGAVYCGLNILEKKLEKPKDG